MPELATTAIDAIGPDKPADWKLAPKAHAGLFKDAVKAGPLVRILQRPELEQIIDAFETADNAALAAQAKYKMVARFAAIASFISIALAAIMLLPRTGAVSEAATTAAVGAQFSCLALSLVASLWLGWRKPFEAWMQQRAEAETQRIRLFRRVTEADEPVNATELPLLPLQLEYFRRFQLDVQRLYYDKRGCQHRAAVRRRLIWRGLALILIACAALPVLWTFQGKDWLPQSMTPLLATMPPKTELAQRVFLCLGLVGGAMQGLLAAQSLISYDERNGARYHDTWQNLEALSGRPLDEARNAAAQGDRERVLTLIALAHEQISSEHREWVSLRSVSPELSLDRLRELTLPRLG